MTSAYRDLPSVDALLRHPSLRVGDFATARDRLVYAAREALAEARAGIAAGQPAPDLDGLANQIAARLQAERQPYLRPVINASGVILQTNLGRAPLSTAAIEAMRQAAAGYSNLEFDLEAGERGSRQAGIGRLLTAATGAEAGLAVNNNAAAVLLTLAALAAGREVLVSRGELVEIGGGFRIPVVLAQSGARLVEVGTTNRTYARDYAAAIGTDTAAILRVHPSNFALQGFVHRPELGELATVAHDRSLLLLDDLGSGALLDTTPLGLAHEPTVQESIAAGADVVCFSGDKLLGGPQSGLIAGRAEPLRLIARHPLARAVRIDKLSLAAAEATLRQYVLGEAERDLPVWHMLRRPLAELEAQVRDWQRQLAVAYLGTKVVEGRSTIGGGSLPGETLPTWLLAVLAPDVDAFARRLRRQHPAIVCRIQHDALLLDPRTVLPDEEQALVEGLIAAWGDKSEPARD